MAEIIYMPRLSDTMKEGTIVKWYKKVGEKVLNGEILAEIETDKAIQEFESEYKATLLYIGVKEGEKAKVNDILAIMGERNENIDYLIKKNKNKKILVSPLAKKIALEKGIKLKTLKGSGPKNRIVKKDIIKSIKTKNNKKYKIKNISNIRKIISERLLKSKKISPHYYLFIEIPADNLIRFKKYINKKYTSKISFNDLIVKATALSLKKNQKINSSLKKERIIYHKDINIGIAVSLPEGLIVPVINTVEKKSLIKISKEIKEKIKRYRNKKISNNELEGSTFTISNLGMFGIDCFTSIINQPNSSILSVGSIQRKPIVDKNKIKIGNTIKFTLACDHRIIDGVIGSTFLLTLKEYLLEPITMLI
ncbi:Dihydrolipoamide acetyltransferase component of pyruvate dehydrogenase complex (E2 subunit) [Candidatus Karelsulcia muelleri]|uniref:dihydrolipoamide acetyltransferase family protein n=1 Tax=Candidatus Karelsulcia muelleri TaxID=336810 RepID=UPI001FF18196|nr:dihydrolipoamide acetyltransferase family protein [Candidatus Karelsulcia muelleri]UOQ38232.1 Dihydrolipoamide acetyltransferase component of pyruvate dehydrogenase complex (E2 subunit) [Candidatus Karelsulcia muelleri]